MAEATRRQYNHFSEVEKVMQVFQPVGVSEIDTRKIAAEYRMAQWTQRLQARASSGQSVKDFCVAAGVNRNVSVKQTRT